VGGIPIRGSVVARGPDDLKRVAFIQPDTLIEEITANSDNISEGELVYVSDGSEDGTKGLTENGIEELQSLLADIRTWDGGIREFLIETQCDPEIIDRIMVDEMKRGL
jgi:hypothetical protein